ncbi:MAG: hypothetical protein U9R36_06490 [Elusimicrobiota bacterium]|nr:hypothetical protein [Elusimicrobiota bacterium]
MPNIKISGITNTKDAKWAALLGVEYISISLVKESTKKVSLRRAAEILELLPSYTGTILEIGNTENDISFKKAAALEPDYFSISDPSAVEAISSYNKPDRRQKFILELSPPQEEEKLPDEIEFVQFNLDGESAGDLDEVDFESNKDIIVNGDFELSEIIKLCKKINPHAWSIRSVIEKSPRRIDYDKMKEYIREIALV